MSKNLEKNNLSDCLIELIKKWERQAQKLRDSHDFERFGTDEFGYAHGALHTLDECAEELQLKLKSLKNNE